MADILDRAEQGNTDEVIQEMRVRSLCNPYYFEKVLLNCDGMVDHLHGKELEGFVDRLSEGSICQWIEWPRGHFKTTCFTIGMSIWFILPHTPEDRRYAVDILGIDPEFWDRRMKLHNQDYVQLLAFENIKNATRKIFEIKQIFEQNFLFRACFPEIAFQGDENPWNTEALRIRRTQRGSRIGEATFQAIGVDGALQSQHYDIVWEDDIVGKSAVDSDTIMKSTIIWHGLLFGTTPGPNLGAAAWRFGVSNVWAFNDLNSHVRKNEKEFQFHRRSLYEMNPETGTDEPIFPEVFTWEEIERRRKRMNKRDFACQYLNTPIPPGDSSVSSEAVHKFTVDEAGKITCSCGFTTYPSHLRRYMHYDPYNAKATSTSCPAISVVGLASDKHTFLLDYFTARGSYARIYDQIVSYNDKYWPEVITYEDVGHQNMTEFYLRQLQKTEEFKKAAHRQFRRIMPSGTKGRDKKIRIMDSLFPVIEHGKFSVRDKHQTFLGMLDTFPYDVPDHDYDLLDSLAQGPAFWRYPLSDEDEKAMAVDDEALISQIGKPYSHHALRVN